MTLNEIENRLRNAGCGNSRGEAYILAGHFCKIPRSRLVIMRDEQLQSEELEKAVLQREKRIPLQYIIGKWQFMSETYEVNPSVLIPRADTEILVEYGIKNISPEGVFADLCSGSGCVAVSTLAARKDLSCVAVEKYSGALETAIRNAKVNNVGGRIKFFLADVTVDFLPPDQTFDAVLTNPPYVSSDEYAVLSPEVKSEPPEALTDGADGLSIISKIIEIYPRRLNRNGFIAMEIASSQGGALKKLAAENNLRCKILKDYSGLDRVAVLEK